MHRGGAEATQDDRGFRRRPGDVRGSVRVSRHDQEHGAWRKDRDAGRPSRGGVRQLARLSGGEEALVLCANNYLGLADDPRVIAAARAALDRWGYGMASVRFICGTQEQHKELEREIASFLNTEDSILYSSCFDAN